MKQKQMFNRLLVFMLVISFLMGKSAPVQAAENGNKYTISLNKSVYTLKKGKTIKLKATLSKTAQKKGVVWSSNNQKIADVSQNGRITAKKNGKATITAKIKGTKVKAHSRITVGTPVSKVKLNKQTLSLKKGSSFTLKTTISPKEAAVKKVTYTSSNAKVASVNKNGVIRAVSEGTAEIKAEAADGSGKKAFCTVKVEAASEEQEKTDTPKNNKILVAYFSWSGTSERIAKNIISQTNADSFQIERETPYSGDYSTVAYGDAKEEADNNTRPPIKAPSVSVEQYDKIILCYPIWWHTAPMTVGTFLESYDLTGKMIYPISQSASMDVSQYNQSVAFVKECAKGAVVDDGLFTRDNDEVREYIENTVLKP